MSNRDYSEIGGELISNATLRRVWPFHNSVVQAVDAAGMTAVVRDYVEEHKGYNSMTRWMIPGTMQDTILVITRMDFGAMYFWTDFAMLDRLRGEPYEARTPEQYARRLERADYLKDADVIRFTNEVDNGWDGSSYQPKYEDYSVMSLNEFLFNEAAWSAREYIDSLPAGERDFWYMLGDAAAYDVRKGGDYSHAPCIEFNGVRLSVVVPPGREGFYFIAPEVAKQISDIQSRVWLLANYRADEA